jgi:hypothetical protein
VRRAAAREFDAWYARDSYAEYRTARIALAVWDTQEMRRAGAR